MRYILIKNMKNVVYKCFCWLFAHFCSIKRNKILFMSYYGGQYYLLAIGW